MDKGLEALENLMKNYYEMCLDTNNNDDEYQRNNLTSEYHIIEKELKEREQYKAIEDELGIDLITLSKALKNGIYVIHNGRLRDLYILGEELDLQLDFAYKRHCLSYLVDDGNDIDYFDFYLKDYGKTWALTKEELL